MKAARGTKDPGPTAANSGRVGPGGNCPVTGEQHGGKKAEHVKEGQRFTVRTGGETQPCRENGDGNTAVTGEQHGGKKAEYVK